MTGEFAERDKDTGVVHVSYNPGNIASDMQRHVKNPVERTTLKWILHPIPLGTLTGLWAAVSEEGAQMNGKVSYPFTSRC